MLSITQDADFEANKGYEGLVAIKFFASWCHPCTQMEPSWIKMTEEFKDDYKFFKVNTDDSQEFTKKFNVKSLPTMLLLKDGIEVKRIIGLVLIEPMRKVFKESK